MALPSLGAVVEVLQGLYYSIAGAAVFNKLVGGGEEYDVITPAAPDRPQIDSSTGYGLLGFSAGIYGPIKVPDSGIVTAADGAYTMKLPWEVHLRRRAPPANIYNPEDRHWTHLAEQLSEQLRQRTGIRKDASKLRFSMPEEVHFSLSGEWWNVASPGERVLPFEFRLKGGRDFSEVTLGDMSRLNRGLVSEIVLHDGGKAQPEKIKPEEPPIFYDLIYFPWPSRSFFYLTFHQVHIRALSPTTTEELLIWFDYQDPMNVLKNFQRQQPSPASQDLEYTWW